MCQWKVNKSHEVKARVLKSFVPKKFKYALVDQCLKELIEYLNKNGFRTIWCCCGHRSEGWIASPYIDFVCNDKKKAIEIIAIILRFKPSWRQYCWALWHKGGSGNKYVLYGDPVPELSDKSFTDVLIAKKEATRKLNNARFNELLERSVWFDETVENILCRISEQI